MRKGASEFIRNFHLNDSSVVGTDGGSSDAKVDSSGQIESGVGFTNGP